MSPRIKNKVNQSVWAPIARHFGLLLALVSGWSAHSQTVVLTNLWNLPAGSRDYVTTAANERGIAINPVTGHTLIVSRSGGLNVVIVDGITGEDIGRLDTTDVAGGTFALSAIGVAADGAIYGANLVTGASETTPFKIYRWADESAVPTVAYSGVPSPNMRFGDALDVRGAGAATQIVGGSGPPPSGTQTGVRFAVFTTTDGQLFEARAYSPASMTSGNMQKGISFGAGDTVYGTANGVGAVRVVQFNLATGAATLVRSITISTGVSPIVVDTTNGLLVAVGVLAPNLHQLLIYDIADPTAPGLLNNIPFPVPNVANGNGVGAVDIANGRIVALDTQNGVLAIGYTIDLTPLPPAIATQPASQSVFAGANVSLAVGVTGTKPFTYAWYLNETNRIAGASSASLVISNVNAANSGSYRVAISNSVGFALSAPAVVNVTPLVKSGRFVPAWSIAPGDTGRPYVANDNNQRGMAFNPATTNLVLVSRTQGTTNIYVLNALTGAERHLLRTTDADGVSLISSGTFLLNMIGVSDDGAIYACNLTTTGDGFKIYRWADDQPGTIPTLCYGPDNPGLGGRCGDTIDVRGAGPNSQILVGSRSGRGVAVFTTLDGETFAPTAIITPDATEGNFGLGVAFGAGDTFWGKANGTGFSLRQVAFNLDNGEGTTVADFTDPAFPASVAPIGVDPVTKTLAAIALETPDNLRLYDISNTANPPVLIHQELFPRDNANLNGTGAVDFGAGHVFALDSNNGIVALRIVDPSAEPPVLSFQRNGNTITLTWTGPAQLQAAPTVTGSWTTIPGAVSGYTASVLATTQTFWRLMR